MWWTKEPEHKRLPFEEELLAHYRAIARQHNSADGFCPYHHDYHCEAWQEARYYLLNRFGPIRAPLHSTVVR